MWTSFPQYPQSLRAIKQNGGENSPPQRNFLQAVEIFYTWLGNFPHRFPTGQKSLRLTRRENVDFCVSLLYSITSFCINLTLILTHGQVMRESFPHWGHNISPRYKFSTIYVDKFSTLTIKRWTNGGQAEKLVHMPVENLSTLTINGG